MDGELGAGFMQNFDYDKDMWLFSQRGEVFHTITAEYAHRTPLHVLRFEVRLAFTEHNRKRLIGTFEPVAEDEPRSEPEEAPIMGWRIFGVSPAGYPAPYSNGAPWSWGENVAACARRGTGHMVDHPDERSRIPAPGCGCGFWAYRSHELLVRHGPSGPLTAMVAMGGDVMESEWGVRASHARIVALLDNQDTKDTIVGGARIRAAGVPGISVPDHVPVLSMAECEMLALEMGLDWNLPPLPKVLEVGQYVYLKDLKDPEPWEEAFYYPNGRRTVVAAILFSVPADDAMDDPSRCSSLFRLDDKQPHDRMTVELGTGEKKMQVKLRPSYVHLGPHRARIWTLCTGNLERDVALARAQKKYGTEWLRRYEV